MHLLLDAQSLPLLFGSAAATQTVHGEPVPCTDPLAAINGFKAATQDGAPVWLALSLRVWAALDAKAQTATRTNADIAGALHRLWQTASQHAARQPDRADQSALSRPQL